MRRHAHANPLMRRRLDKLLRKLKSKDLSKRPRHLSLACVVLRDELGVTEKTAFAIIASSSSAAFTCAEAINRRVGAIVEFQTCEKLCNAFERIANCAKRAPAELRRRLDAAVTPLIRQEHVDLEVIETIFDTAVEVFSEYSRHEVAKTALGVLMHQPPGGGRYMTVKNDFLGLSAKDQIKSEKALTALGKVSKKRKTTASDVFATLATVLKCKQSAKLNSQIHTLIVDYITTVVEGWRHAGLRPSRARNPAHPAYKSRFHRFVDLVLTEMVEPWTCRLPSLIADCEITRLYVATLMRSGIK